MEAGAHLALDDALITTMDPIELLPETGFTLKVEHLDGDTDIMALRHPTQEIYALPFFCEEAEAAKHAALYREALGGEWTLSVFPIDREAFLSFYHAAIERDDPRCSGLVLLKEGCDPVFMVEPAAMLKLHESRKLD